MASLPFTNLYNKRRVAETAAKPCFVCYKPSPVVLVSDDAKPDFFYVCEIHLKDVKFAAPKTNVDADALKKRQEQIDAEIEALKKRWAEREKKKNKKDDKDDKDDKDKDNDDKTSKRSMDKLVEEKAKVDSDIKKDPRTFTLNQDMFRLRIQKYKSMQQSKRTADMLKKPNLFPSVPKHSPGQSPGQTPGQTPSPSPGPGSSTDPGNTPDQL